MLTLGWACIAGLMTLRVYPGMLLFMAVVSSGGVLGVTWCVLLVSCLIRRTAGPAGSGRVLAWGLCPAVGLLLTVMFVSRIPLVLRVAVSEGALLDLVEKEEPGRAGAMFVQTVVVQGRCVFLLTNHAPIFKMYGLVYVEDAGRPEGEYLRYATTYEHLVGRWWTFEARD